MRRAREDAGSIPEPWEGHGKMLDPREGHGKMLDPWEDAGSTGRAREDAGSMGRYWIHSRARTLLRELSQGGLGMHRDGSVTSWDPQVTLPSVCLFFFNPPLPK